MTALKRAGFLARLIAADLNGKAARGWATEDMEKDTEIHVHVGTETVSVIWADEGWAVEPDVVFEEVSGAARR